jgi:uncharacterized protein with HEPN domain
MDILDAIRKIEKYTKDIAFDDFIMDELIQDGIVRNLEVIGEAVKNIPEDIKDKKPEVEWKKIAGLREASRVERENKWDTFGNRGS